MIIIIAFCYILLHPEGNPPSLRTEGQYFNVLVLCCPLLIVLFRGTASTYNTHKK